MKTKNMKILNNDMYLLLIDEEAEIKVGDFITDTHIVWQWKDDSSLLGRKLVIAYYPLNSEAKELDLPLLPNPFEEEPLMKQASKLRELRGYHKDNHYSFCGGFIEGYKAAQSRQYSLEDMKKAIKMAKGLDIKSGVWFKCDTFSEEEIIQSLSTQRLPKEFIPKYQKDWKETTKMLMESMGDDPEDFKYEETLKTITNSNGKEELVGVYKY